MNKRVLIFSILLLIAVQFYSITAEKLEAKEVDFHNFPNTNDTYENQYYRESASSEKSYSKKNTSAQSAKTGGFNYKLDAIAKRALKAAENRDSTELNKCAQDFVDAGVTNIYPPEVVTKRTPNCPPIEMEINGKTLKGSTCVKMGYQYKGKIYWSGYCKP